MRVPETDPTARVSARILLLDPDDRILLLRFRMIAGDDSAGHGWCTPGGGWVDGEALPETAARELAEETGVLVEPAQVGQPVAVIEGYADLGIAAGIFRDHFFFARTTATEIDTGRMEDLERSYHAGHRWWTIAEIEASDEFIVPWGLAGLLRDLVAGRVPAEPVRLPWHH
jgi:8-oxo-dGTP pyrophosphatase MutT (NUDIX family)